MTVLNPSKLINSTKFKTNINKSLHHQKCKESSTTSSSTFLQQFIRIYSCTSTKTLSMYSTNKIKLKNKAIIFITSIKAISMIPLSSSPMRKNKFTEDWLRKSFICMISSLSPTSPNSLANTPKAFRKNTILEVDMQMNSKNWK